MEHIAPVENEVVSRYSVGDVGVCLASPKQLSNGLYLVDPPEYSLSPAILGALKDSVAEITSSAPGDARFDSLGMARPYIMAKAKDCLYSRLSVLPENAAGTERLEREVENLAELLSRYTAGFGILETLIEDRLVQDIYVDAPSSQTPVHVVLSSDAPAGVRQKCRTNIMVGRRDMQGLVSRLKFETGMPFSEARPVLEADLPRLNARVTLVGPPVSPKGVSLAIRKHSTHMWAMPGLIANGTVSPLLASFLWACVAGRRTVLVAGSRGAGKTTLLCAMMLEFPLSQRIIVIEDTPEIPVRRLQELGYDVQALRFSSTEGDEPVSAQDTLRVSLRMGESAIVIGEVRGEEARVLYESMRAGSAGSAVLGTIHANSAKGVLDRAVEDLGVSERAFSSTNLIVVIGLVRSPDGSRFLRRVVEVSEVRDSGANVSLAPLFRAERGISCAMPTEDFSAQCRTVQGIARALGVSGEEVIEIVKARAHADQLFSELGDVAEVSFEAGGEPLRVLSNEHLTHCLLNASTPESGLTKWREWLESRQGL